MVRPDAELVRAALGGDKEAFAGLITRHWATAVALATRLLGSADLARDAAQEASIAALTGLGRLRDPERFGPWFCGIALNVARRWRRQLRAEPAAVLPDQASAEPSPAERAELAELALEVRAAVAQLAPGQRQAVLLFYLQGLTHREVAAELAISVGAVKARLHQARAALTPSLAPLIEEETDDHCQQPGLDRRHRDRGPHGPARRQPDGPWTADGQRPRPGSQHVMVLAERDGERRMPVWVGPAEAGALAISLEAQETPRPLTYQMAARLLEADRVEPGRGAHHPAHRGDLLRHGHRRRPGRPPRDRRPAQRRGQPRRADRRADPGGRRRARRPRRPGPGGPPGWQQLPAATAQIAAEARQQMRWPR